MRVRHRYDHWLPKILGVGAITLYPWICYRAKSPSPRILRHEWVHVEQVRRVGWLRFYLQYLWEYFVNLARHRDHFTAYEKISFEIEAYARESESSIQPQDLPQVQLT